MKFDFKVQRTSAVLIPTKHQHVQNLDSIWSFRIELRITLAAILADSLSRTVNEELYWWNSVLYQTSAKVVIFSLSLFP